MLKNFKKLNQRIKQCKKCPLWRTRIRAVPGEGSSRAKVLIIGEAPGREEDKQGRPFCGRAGKFLNELLGLIELKREKIFITNVVKCRPPNNRRPKKEEIEKCRPWLEQQIKILKPKFIIALGALALNWFFPRTKISKIHGRIQYPASSIKYQVFFTFHPAAAFRRGNLRQVLKNDFRKLKNILRKR